MKTITVDIKIPDEEDCDLCPFGDVDRPDAMYPTYSCTIFDDRIFNGKPCEECMKARSTPEKCDACGYELNSECIAGGRCTYCLSMICSK